MKKLEKYIGVIKWFYDQSSNANYGFIKHAMLGDLFFHERGIADGQELNSFKENEIVVFTPQESRKYKDKVEATQVILLSNENDLNFLFNSFLAIIRENEKNYDLNNIKKAISLKLTTEIQEIDLTELNNFYIDYKKICLLHLKELADYNLIRGYFYFCKTLFKNQFTDFCNAAEIVVSNATAHELWLDKYFATCKVDYISRIIFSESRVNQNLIFSRCSEIDKQNIFKSIVRLDVIGTTPSFERLKIILKLSDTYASSWHHEILKDVLDNCSGYYKLMLWLEGCHHELHFDDYKILAITLNPEDQKKFIKKTLQYIHEDKEKITLEQLASINIVDYEISKSIEVSDAIKLDYSTSIILNTILELSKKTKFETKAQEKEAQHKLFNLILDQIKEPTDILEIKDYFDLCEGRCVAAINNDENNTQLGACEGKSLTFKFTRNAYIKPHPICDGRKFLERNGIPVLCEKTGREYWWCANQKCYKPSRKPHPPHEWEKYTLLDFLIILKIEFIEQDLEIYLNLINKTNRFLKHLKCRECNHILRPVGKSNYAFYGVNNFECINDSCSENKKQVYLTHCLNGRCEHEIDSRDSVKCKNGWYICNYCHSCCSTRQIASRISNLESRGQLYKGPREGHRDLGMLFCNKCGEEMDGNTVDLKSFNEILDWFNENKGKSIYIGKYGANKANKRWFIFKRADQSVDEFKSKLNYYLGAGFNIPNINEDVNYQMISEPLNFEKRKNDVLICNNCHHLLDLSADFERLTSIRYFHNVKLGKT